MIIRRDRMKGEEQRRTIKLMWKIHFSLGLLILCFGMLCNDGRKYISADPAQVLVECKKLYVNVHSSSPDEDGAMICCNDYLEQWQKFFSYEGFLCNPKVRAIPLSRSLTRFPDSWLLPLVPIGLRLMISISNLSHPSPHDMWTSSKRLILHISIFQFRGWGLYIFLNMLQNTVLGKISSLDSSGTAGQGTFCWYTPMLKKRWQDSDPCYGSLFDFSDHIVLFFSHILPALLLEALFCFLHPFWPNSNSKFKADEQNSDKKNSSFRVSLNAALSTTLLVAFVYLTFISLVSIHSTAAYFHSIGEVLVGYLISLSVQIPVGWIVWAKDWNHVRRLVGFPYQDMTN